MYKFIILAFGIMSLTMACSLEEKATESTEKAVAATVSTIKTIEGLPPIYENYEELATIFEQQNDTTYVINFWSTWCAPCVKELPYFEALNQKYAADKVKVILVSLDFPKQLETKLKPFLAKNKLQSELLVLVDPDANSWVDKVNPDWSGAIPATVVYKGEKDAFYEKSFENLVELEEVVMPFL
ncbi:MAG: TlpA disulfide reductase family protein [Bacteroidota bacterium]